MLAKLRIKNYVLINELDVSFNNGLSIITGETGAGKSILLGALGLVLGDRADAKTLLDKNKKCFIEAEFTIKDYGLQDFFKAHDLDYESCTIIRREISPEGKSRAFINDTPVNLNLLKELSENLVDIHSQHQTLSLTESVFQLRVLDAVAAHAVLLKQYQQVYARHRTLEKLLADLIEKEHKSKAEFDFIQFQFNELDLAQLQQGEKEKLELELQLLTNTETILSSLSSAGQLLDDGNDNAIQALTQSFQVLNHVTKFHEGISALATRIQACKIEVKDIAAEINALQNDFHVNPYRLEIINERIDAYNKLEQKHRVTTAEELIALRNSFSDKLFDFSSMATEIEKTKVELAATYETLDKLSSQLTDNRKKASVKLKKEMANLLSEVVLPDAKFDVEISRSKDFNASGYDHVQFLFSANKGTTARELGKVASGGEMSRLMLCIKTILADSEAMPTIIFDEIDSGISGEVAFKVGGMIENLSSKRQVLAITHLPQMASKGKTHYFVYKQAEKGITKSAIKVLDKDERILEIAKMLSGENITDASMENAKELLLR